MVGRPQLRCGSTYVGTLAVLAGVILGGVVGVLYGQTMWIASGGAVKKLEILDRTVQQKQEFAKTADADGQMEEAERLREQVPVIQDEIRQVETLVKESRHLDLSTPLTVWQLTKFLGDLFLRMLLLVVLPLVFTSIVSGVTSLGDINQLGKVGVWTLVYYAATCAMAVAIGIFLVQMIEPGIGTDDTFAYVDPEFLSSQDTTLLGTLLNVVTGGENNPAGGMVPSNIFLAASRNNFLALILFAMVLGGSLISIGEKGKVAIDFFHALNEAMLKIVRLIIWFAPIGIYGLVATQIANTGGGGAFYVELERLMWFVITVTLGLAIHTAVLCIILWTIGKRNPFSYIGGLSKALLTAFSTDSSSATLPVTIECVEESGVSERAAGFVLPLGATINMDGTALYEATAAIFIAQSAGIPLSGAALVIIFITATLAAIGAPGIPNAGLVTMLVVLSAVNLPVAGIGTILAIDWFLDRERTMVNVFGDAVGGAVIDRFLPNESV